jgi:hypothetical protein
MSLLAFPLLSISKEKHNHIRIQPSIISRLDLTLLIREQRKLSHGVACLSYARTCLAARSTPGPASCHFHALETVLDLPRAENLSRVKLKCG